MMAQKNLPGVSSINRPAQKHAEKSSAFGRFVDDYPSLERTITDLLQQMNIPAHIKGYHYLRKAILLEVESGETGGISAKVLFPKVAKHFGATPDKVDRGIRYALGLAWQQCDLLALQSAYCFTVRFAYDKPTNLEFIACVADYYKLKIGC